jgi:hypothetical protein
LQQRGHFLWQLILVKNTQVMNAIEPIENITIARVKDIDSNAKPNAKKTGAIRPKKAANFLFFRYLLKSFKALLLVFPFIFIPIYSHGKF